MQKKLFALCVVCVALCAIATFLYTFTAVFKKDSKPPQISVPGGTLEVTVAADDAALLAGVTAKDNRDGDVTGTIVIEGISNIGADHTATVTYAAFDKAGNVAKATRTLHYTDYTPPVFDLTRALVFPAGGAANILSCVTVTDALDGDLSSRVKGSLTGETTSLAQEGIHQVTFRVTNNMGQTVRLTVPVTVYAAGTYNAAVTLTDYLVYLEKGASFSARNYLGYITCGGSSYSLKSGNADFDISIDGDVDTSVPGTYCVNYTVSVGQYKGLTSLIVVVEE